MKHMDCILFISVLFFRSSQQNRKIKIPSFVFSFFCGSSVWLTTFAFSPRQNNIATAVYNELFFFSSLNPLIITK